MTRSVYNILSIVGLLLMQQGTLLASSPQDTCKTRGSHEVRKEIHHEMRFANRGTIEISNKYGQVNISTWDKEEVHIDVEIIVRSNSKSRAEEQVNLINIDMHQDDDFIRINTEFEDKDKSWWQSLWSEARSEMEINYKAFIPATTKLTVHNKYGNTQVDDLANDLSIWMKYGNVTCSDVEGEVDLYVGYGKASIGTIGKLQAEVEYGDFVITEADNVHMESKYSKGVINTCKDINVKSKYDSYQLGSIGDFNNEGKYDSYRIDNARSIYIDTKYTKVKANYLEKSLEAAMQHGSIKVLAVSPVFEYANVEAKYTTIYLKMTNDLRYNIESKYASPTIYGTCRHSDYEKDGSYEHMEGFRGSSSAKAMVSIDSKYGSIKID